MAAPKRVKTGSLYDQGETVRVLGLDTWLVRAGPRGGTPIVFLHGIPTSAYVYRDVITALHEEHDCIAFDWPGYGLSGKPRHGDYSHRARADHLRATLDALGIARCHLVVHDVGGPAGILFAVEDPQRVESLVVLNTTVYKRDFRPPLPALLQFIPVVRDVVRPLFTRPAFDFFFKQGLAEPTRMPRHVLDNHWALASSHGGRRAILDTWASFPEGAKEIQAIRDGMRGYEGRVLVLFGAEDPFLPPENAERLAQEFPHAELQLLPGVGHFVQEEAPDVVVERLLKFFAEGRAQALARGQGNVSS